MSERDAPEHTNTILTNPDAGADRAGYEQSISPLGEVPPPDEIGDTQTDDAPIANRVGHDPGNLGDDVPSEGDVVHPAPINEPLGKTPGM